MSGENHDHSNGPSSIAGGAAAAVELVEAALDDGIELRRRLRQQAPAIAAAGSAIVAAFARGGKVLLCGNGGSAADCQHIAAELTGRFGRTERAALPAISLTTDTSALTAIANDYGYDRVFARQVEALARPGDVLLALSTSGRSPSVVAAARAARAAGARVIGLCGPQPGPLGEHCDQVLCVPGTSPERIQELHITVGHILCALVERALLPGGSGPAS